MKTKVTRKVVLMCSAVLLGIAVCISLWLFLREHKARDLVTNNELIAERINTGQVQNNPDENQGDEPLTLEENAERAAQTAKNNYISMLSEEELARPDIQKRIDVYDSPGYREWVKETMVKGTSQRQFWDVLESQGIPVDRGVFAAVFRKVFPTGEPEDYEQEMRVEMAELFLATEAVDLTDPVAAAQQRSGVYSKFMRQSNRNFAWLAGRFDADWDGVSRTESNPALEWVRDVQHNASGIVAGADATGASATDANTSASSWDLSSGMESPPASHSETEVPTTPDTSGSVLMTDAEIEAAIEKSLTSQPRDVPPDERPDTPSEIQNQLETNLKSQFSSERFERAMSTLERYGPEDGLRRLRENDPEVANQIEQHRKRGGG